MVTEDEVIPVASVDAVGAGAADEDVVGVAARDGIIAALIGIGGGDLLHHVVGVAGERDIIANDDVLARAAQQAVARRPTNNDLVAGSAGDDVGTAIGWVG